MNTIKWSHINDYLFVKLAGDLLARLGFVDVDFQGDGPDGGIDLFATELLPFTIQGRIPFRWAIQCKFSSDPGDRSVNDGEVKDVEGILRSERYATQRPRGYMLITNRRIVQNVVERLRGIDRATEYRTARLDGAEMNSLLHEHPQVFERYFLSSAPGGIPLCMPDVVGIPTTSASGQVAPHVTLHLQLPPPAKSKMISVQAIVDTSAPVTVIPKSVLDDLGGIPESDFQASSVGGDIGFLHRVLLDIIIERGEVLLAEVLGWESDQALLGMDILRRFTVVINPDGTVHLYRKPKKG